MKLIHQTVTATLVASLAWFAPTDRAAAADITLDGAGFYDATRTVGFRSRSIAQSGRYSTLGPDFYRRTTYGMQFVTNRSTQRSGPLSFEFWGMPFYGATEGVVLATRGIKPLGAGGIFHNLRRTTWALYLDERRFPEINIWEFRERRGWRFRDALSFKRRTVL